MISLCNKYKYNKVKKKVYDQNQHLMNSRSIQYSF